jgi:hypothetical protein
MAQGPPKLSIDRQETGGSEALHWQQRGREYEKESLIPGLPNEITIFDILTKLPSRYLFLLASLSTCWQQAMSSKEVRDARIRAGCSVSKPLTASKFYALKANEGEKDKSQTLLQQLGPASRFYSRGRGKRIHAISK